MWRGGEACRGPISGMQDIRKTVGSPFAESHFDYRSNHSANHVLQKSVGVGLNMDLVVVADDGESLQMANGVGVVSEASFEGGKILWSDQC